MITIRYFFEMEDLLNWIYGRKTACELWRRDRDRIARLYRRRGYQFVNQWVIEKHRGLHVHCLINLPDDRTFERELAELLCKIGDESIPIGRSALHVVKTRHSGCSVHLLMVDPLKSFNGEYGFLGLVEYTGKKLNNRLVYYKPRGVRLLVPKPLSRGLRIGKQQGCSETLSAAAAKLFP